MRNHPRLDLDDCPHVRVFRVAVDAIRRDPTLARFVRRWRTWDGDPEDWRDPVEGELPCVELAIAEGADEFYGPAGFVGPLRVEVVVTTAGVDQTLPVNLYWAVKRALYPDDAAARDTIHDALVAAGAQGQFLLRFTAPNFAPVRRPGGLRISPHLVGYGSFEVPVIDMLNP